MEYTKEYIVQFAIRIFVVVYAAGATVFFIFSFSTIAIILAPMGIAAILMQFYHIKPERQQAPSPVNYYQETAEMDDNIEVHIPRLQEIPEEYFDWETIKGDNGEKWWLYYVMIPNKRDPLTSYFHTYLLDPFAKYSGSNRVMDALRIEIRSMPEKRLYTKLKMVASRDIFDLMTDLRSQGVNDLNAGELFKAMQESKQDRKSSLQKTAMAMSATTR